VLEPNGLGDMIVDGVSRRAVRPLNLSGPDGAEWAPRRQFWRSWPRLVIDARALRAST
jgi:uncharacterized protein involved in outer membrane biogenesis